MTASCTASSQRAGRTRRYSSSNRSTPASRSPRAHAQTVDYSIAEQRIKLTGEAFLSTGDTEYTGGTIVWDMKENAVDCRDGCRYKDLRPPTD